jgi:GNAT superfamily N-acetyltransferase
MAEYKVIVYNGPALPDNYKPMIYSKWLRSLRYGNDYFKLIQQDAYFTNYHKYLELVLNKSDTMVRMAVLSDDYDVVLGFAVCRPSIVDYVHIHKDYRRQGIGSALIASLANVSFITHLTRNGMSFWNNKLKDAKFNPFI